MDREVMGVIETEVAKLPVPKQEDFRLYEESKRRLGAMFPGWEEQEYLRKAIARRFGI